MSVVVAIQGGGTHCIVAVASEPREIGSGAPQVEVPTSDPDATFAALADAAHDLVGERSITAVGVASFGPLERRLGRVAQTPKPGWSGFDWRGRCLESFGKVPIVVETDVTAAALAEWQYGAAIGARVTAYVTVGTGIGAGVLLGGNAVAGAHHAEMGHIRVPRVDGDRFVGICPFHGDCLEGLASGPAIAARWGIAADDLAPEHPAWALESAYLGAGLATTMLIAAPDRLVLGGGVGARPHLLESTRSAIERSLAGYLGDLSDPIGATVVAPHFVGNAELVGAGLLASRWARPRRVARTRRRDRPAAEGGS
jgi:fructokinase